MLESKVTSHGGFFFPGDIQVLRLVLAVCVAAAISALIATAADAAFLSNAPM